jgi:hypothetical protein
MLLALFSGLIWEQIRSRERVPDAPEADVTPLGAPRSAPEAEPALVVMDGQAIGISGAVCCTPRPVQLTVRDRAREVVADTKAVLRQLRDSWRRGASITQSGASTKDQ